MTVPFRWSIAKREQLGSLIDEVASPSLNRHQFLAELRTASARVLALSNGADIAFIGRTPENFYDYLSGIFSGVANAPGLNLVQFSLRWPGSSGVAAIDPHRLQSFFDYLSALGLDPPSIAKHARSIALVDFIAGGGTMENFIKLMHLFCQETNRDWPAVARKLRIIGLRTKTYNSPNTWRWQQHQDWLGLIPETPIKNVSVPAHIMYHLANSQDKVTLSHHQYRWGESDKKTFEPTEKQRQALAFAAKLYDAGNSRAERRALAQLVSRQREMTQPATRSLVLQLKQC